MMMMMMMMMMMNFFSSNQDARDTLQDDLLIRYHDIRQGIYHNLTQNDNVKAFLKETYGDVRARARTGGRRIGSGRGSKSQRFLIEKLWKTLISSAGPGRGPGIENSTAFN